MRSVTEAIFKSHLLQRLRARWSRQGLALANGDGQRPRGEGPPDLEELWQDLNRRLLSLFGRRPRMNAPGPNGAPVRNPRGFGAALVGIIAAALAAWLVSGAYQIPEGSAGVILRFGKYLDTTGAGWHWHFPYPIESVEKVNLSAVRSIEIGGNSVIRDANLKDSSMLTEDENIIDVRFAVQYRIKNAADYLFNNASPDETVKQAAETAVREIVGRSTMDFVLYEGREKTGFDLNQSIQHILDLYKTGILVTSVTMQNVQPPEQVQAAFDDAVKAGQDQERSKNEGQAYANDVIPCARGDAARVIQEAEGYKAKVVATAEGDAQRFKQVLAQYAKAPEVTRERMYLQTMQDVYTNSTKVLIDTHGSGNLLYLPLDKLIEQSKAQTPNVSPSSPAVSSPAPAVSTVPAFPSLGDDDRSRDPTKARERETR